MPAARLCTVRFILIIKCLSDRDCGFYYSLWCPRTILIHDMRMYNSFHITFSWGFVICGVGNIVDWLGNSPPPTLIVGFITLRGISILTACFWHSEILICIEMLMKQSPIYELVICFHFCLLHLPPVCSFIYSCDVGKPPYCMIQIEDSLYSIRCKYTLYVLRALACNKCD